MNTMASLFNVYFSIHVMLSFGAGHVVAAATRRHVTPHYVTLRYDTLRYATLRCITLRYVTIKLGTNLKQGNLN